MSKIFYDHLVIIEEITSKLDRYNLDNLAKEELVMLIDETLHHEMMNLILSSLPEKHHEEFLSKLYRNPADESLLEYLKVHSGKDIEKLINEEAKKVKKEILMEIKRSRK